MQHSAPGATAPEAPPSASHRWLAALGAVLAALVALFGRVVTFPFAWDDKSLVRDSPFLRNPANAWLAWRSDFWALSDRPTHSGMYRPLVVLGYFAERVAFGPSAAASHAVNLGVHVLDTGLVAWLARRLGASAWGTAIAAALFGFHPAMVEPIANVAARTDPMAALGVLVAAHLRLGRSGPLARVGAAVAVLAALLSKEQAITAPLLLLLLDAKTGQLAVRELRSWASRLLDPLAAVAAYAAIRFAAMGFATVAPDAAWHPWSGPLTVVRYAALLVVPHPLAPFHDAWDPGPAAGAAAALALALAFALAWRAGGWWRFAFAWFLVALLPVSRWVPLPVRFSELFLYVPMIGVAIAAGAGVGARRWAALAASAVAAAWAVVAALRLPAWSDELVLWEDATSKAPATMEARLNFANALRARGRVPEARAQLETALATQEESGDHARLALLNYNLGNLRRETGDARGAEAAYERALELTRGGLYQAWPNLALVRMSLGELDRAAEAAQGGVAAAPFDSTAWTVAGVVDANRGDLARAEEQFARAVELAPGDAQARRHLERVRAMRRGPAP